VNWPLNASHQAPREGHPLESSPSGYRSAVNLVGMRSHRGQAHPHSKVRAGAAVDGALLPEHSDLAGRQVRRRSALLRQM